MPVTTPRPSRPIGHLDRPMIRQLRRTSWVWFAAFVAAATVTTASASQLGARAWLVLPGGRVTSPSVHVVAGWGLILIGWGWTLALIAAILASGELTREDRAWPAVVVILIVVIGSIFLGAVVVGTLLQLGRAVPDALVAERLLAGPAELAAEVGFGLALLSMVVAPAARRGVRLARARSGTRTA